MSCFTGYVAGIEGFCRVKCWHRYSAVDALVSVFGGTNRAEFCRPPMRNLRVVIQLGDLCALCPIVPYLVFCMRPEHGPAVCSWHPAESPNGRNQERYMGLIWPFTHSPPTNLTVSYLMVPHGSRLESAPISAQHNSARTFIKPQPATRDTPPDQTRLDAVHEALHMNECPAQHHAARSTVAAAMLPSQTSFYPFPFHICIFGNWRALRRLVWNTVTAGVER